jgi:hypothetical protein
MNLPGVMLQAHLKWKKKLKEKGQKDTVIRRIERNGRKQLEEAKEKLRSESCPTPQ